MAKHKKTDSRLPPRGRPPRGETVAPRDDSRGAWLYGMHAVTAALGNRRRRIRRLLATADGAERLTAIAPDAQPEIVERRVLDQALPPGAVHQGVALDVEPLAQPALEDIVAAAAETAIVVILDQVTDPHNVGAVLRSAAAFGALAVIQTERSAAAVTAVLAKAASGGLEIVPLVTVVNLARTLESLKKAGFWCIGLDGSAERTLAEQAPSGRVALVLGAEGGGLRRLTREHCDLLARLPTRPPVASLNVSNAAAIALYELARR